MREIEKAYSLIKREDLLEWLTNEKDGAEQAAKNYALLAITGTEDMIENYKIMAKGLVERRDVISRIITFVQCLPAQTLEKEGLK